MPHYQVNQIRVPLNYSERNVLKNILQKARIQADDLVSWKILRRSLDARRKPVYIITAAITTKKKIKKNRDIQVMTPKTATIENIAISNYTGRKPIIVGAGPAGLMAAYFLADHGIPPIVIDRGSTVTNRAKQIYNYNKNGDLNEDANVLFGEGGAGLFSDGKLTARSKNRMTIRYFFNKLVEAGAPEDILIDAEPHLGSDKLIKIIPGMRQKIIELGGEFHFDTRMKELIIENNELKGIKTTRGNLSSDHVILATGHSARDIYRYLSSNNVVLAAKAFAVGVRIELPQSIVNRSQYGHYATHPKLSAASFRLSRRAEGTSRSCYTFCMCPGGEVMSCTSSAGYLTTNGMSLSSRNGKMANAAFLVPVNRQDFEDHKNSQYPALEGLFFQEAIESKIFRAGGKNYSIPAARLSDFLDHTASSSLPKNYSCKRIKITKVNGILPPVIENNLIHSIPKMLGKIGRPSFNEVIVYCGETRSSSPVRILRNKKSLESTAVSGLYPCGEGSGYAGGIVSSAVDGIRVAKSILNRNKTNS